MTETKQPYHITPAPGQAGQRVNLPVWPDNDVYFEDCIIEAVQDYGHYQQGATVQKYKSATGPIERFRLVVRKYSNEQVWRVVHFTLSPEQSPISPSHPDMSIQDGERCTHADDCPYTPIHRCIECGAPLCFIGEVIYDNRVYCAAHMPAYDKHQQW